MQRELPGIESGRERIDNISDTALRAFRVRYNDNTITKDAIFDYVYGVLHASAYRERFANDLAKELPRIPLAPDFHAFAKAGRELAELHLGYETCEEYSLEVAFAHSGDPPPSHFRIGDRAMRFADDEKTVLAVNEHVSLRGIPASVHTYQVNGRSPLEWFIDRYRITQNKESGIVNDPNGWFDDPHELIAAIRRIVHVSVESTRIVEGLPEPVTMKEVYEITKVDESPIEMNELTIYNTRYRASPRLHFNVSFDQEEHLYDLEGDFGITLSAEARPELESALYETLAMLWSEYAREQPQRLSPQAKRMREELRSRIREECDRA